MRIAAMVTGTTLLAGLFGMAGAQPALGADPGLLGLVMPEARSLAGLNAAAAKVSPLGQFILSKAAGAGQGVQLLEATTGFDPARDVSEVLVASAGDPANPAALVLVRGVFDATKLAAVLGARPGMTVSTYAGATLVSGVTPPQKTEQGVAFPGGTIAVLGDLNLVKGALDRGTVSSSIDPVLAAQVSRLSAADDAWFVGKAPAGGLASGTAAPAGGALGGPAQAILPLLKGVQTISGGVRLGSNVQIDIEALTADAQSAAALAAFLGLAKGIAGANPQAAPAAQVIQDIQVQANGNAVELSLSIPESQLESFVSSFRKGAGAAIQRRIAPADAQPAQK